MTNRRVAPNTVFTLGEGWRVYFDGRVCSPCFINKGAGLAYLSGLESGARQPEYSNERYYRGKRQTKSA